MWSESLQAATRGQGAEQPCRQHMVVGRTEKECVSKTVRTKIRQNVRLVSSSPLRHLSSGRASEAQGLCVVLTTHRDSVAGKHRTKGTSYRYVYVISPSKLNSMVVTVYEKRYDNGRK
jgi:hypothetical protein